MRKCGNVADATPFTFWTASGDDLSAVRPKA